jgi:hypothetical protein
MWAAKAAGSEDGKPVDWRALHREATALDRRVQEIKNVLPRQRGHLDTFDLESSTLKQQKAEEESWVAHAFGRLQAESQMLADKLMFVVNEEEKTLIERASPPINVQPIVQSENTSLPHVSLSLRP